MLLSKVITILLREKKKKLPAAFELGDVLDGGRWGCWTSRLAEERTAGPPEVESLSCSLQPGEDLVSPALLLKSQHP